jgi:hypothetical protein
MDVSLIKAMNDLGPALKSMRSVSVHYLTGRRQQCISLTFPAAVDVVQEAVRTATVKLVDPRLSTPGQITEPQIVRIVGVAR